MTKERGVGQSPTSWMGPMKLSRSERGPLKTRSGIGGKALAHVNLCVALSCCFLCIFGESSLSCGR